MSTKKISGKNYFFVAQHLQCLPFWQPGREICHFGSQAFWRLLVLYTRIPFIQTGK
jgi:hypothetical protein